MHAKKAAKLSAGRKVRRLKGHNIFETWVTFALKNITDGGSSCEDRRVPYKVRAHKIEEYIKNMIAYQHVSSGTVSLREKKFYQDVLGRRPKYFKTVPI